MKRLLVLAFVAAALAACSTSDYDQPGRAPRSGPGGYSGERRVGGDAVPGGLELMLPPAWWLDERLANALNLSADQATSLDRIARDSGDEITRLQRDSGTAVRDLRDQLNAEKAVAADIVAAGERVRAIRDEVFKRQLQMLAAEREVLTHQQWVTLQDQLQSERTRRDDRGGYGRPGGMGGRGGFGGRGGRRPGWGY